jgi:hypothetical protein
MSDIYRKTTLGHEEVASRSHGLSARLRRCLILVDGKRGLKELAFLLQSDDFGTLVQTLELEGYIELIGMVASSASTTLLTPNPSLQAILSMNTTMQDTVRTGFLNSMPLFIDSNGQLRQPLTFKERQLRATRVINELLGPNAEGISLKIESCTDAPSLEAVLSLAASFIADTVNQIAAKRFRDHVRLTHVD